MLINGHSTAHVYRTLKPSLQLSKPLGQAVPWKIAFSFFSTRKNDFFPLAFLLSNTFFGCKMSDHFWDKTDKTTPWLNGIKVTPDVVHCSVGGSEDSNLPGGPNWKTTRISENMRTRCLPCLFRSGNAMMISN
jgi:hypothetical protein